MRGNRAGAGVGLDVGRSIPACAGEPLPNTRTTTPCWVYPRVCGGTAFRCCGDIYHAGLSPRVRGNLPVPFYHALSNRGLSPRVRGNPERARWVGEVDRSIPACAGEPSRWPRTWSDVKVYPRVCGGTGCAFAQVEGGGGLSPRVRGNRPRLGNRTARVGSIPACAGEPGDQANAFAQPSVYPRVCGGTPSLMILGPVSYCAGGYSNGI